MNSLHRYKNLRFTLLLAAILLAAQTLVFWHTHHGKLTPDDSCQLCQYAQHHTPAANSIQAPALALFTAIVITEARNIDTYHLTYQITIPSRAPPAITLI